MDDHHLTARPPDGKTYKRVAKKSLTNNWTQLDLTTPAGFFHWCNTPSPDPIIFDTPAHVCDIWELDTAPETETEPPAAINEIPTVRELMRRVSYTHEDVSAEPVALLNRAQVFASLYQAIALDNINSQLEKIGAILESRSAFYRAKTGDVPGSDPGPPWPDKL